MRVLVRFTPSRRFIGPVVARSPPNSSFEVTSLDQPNVGKQPTVRLKKGGN